MIKANRDGQEMQFEDANELLVFMVENMAMKSELEQVRVELKKDIQEFRIENNKQHADLRDYIDKKTDEIKHNTATLLRNKEIINKEESLQYLRGEV